ncbi:hypothetical protein ACW4TU_41475 [Streptomyces sp. QTS52]
MSDTTDTTSPETDTPDTEPEITNFLPHIACAVTQRLGDGWSWKLPSLGTNVLISGPYVASFDLHVDEDEDLAIGYSEDPSDGFPELDEDEVPIGFGTYPGGVYLVDPDISEGLEVLADRVANAIRFVIGHPLI